MAPIRKLTGAQARLFASICHHYMSAAEDGCNDKPESVPIFSQLGKAQRLKIVREVMIGVLCEDEPLPPDTIQHNAAYRAMIETLFCEIEVELDTQWDLDNVGEDLLKFDAEDRRSCKRTPEEMEEFRLKRDLVEHRAGRNMKRLQKKGKDVGEFHVETKPSSKPTDAQMKDAIGSMREIFLGGPVLARDRNAIRALNKDEKCAFYWRRMCDAALQEDQTSGPFLLSNVNFDWRCQQRDKWYIALNLLLDSRMMSYGTPTDRALIIGSVDYRSFADKEQLPRIREIERHVEILKKVFAPTWDPQLLAQDQRCIFALCSTEIYAQPHHREWLIGFLAEYEARGFDFEEGGNYQARLDIFRDMKDNFDNGCGFPYGCPHDVDRLECHCCKGWEPGDEKPVDFYQAKRCHGPGKPEEIVKFKGKEMKFPGYGMCFKTENLRPCSRCKIVYYCGPDCQRRDWPNHKKQCAQLAAQRKDKEKIAQMAKNL